MARLSRPGWLWLNTKMVYPQTVTHRSTNRARHRATVLIETNALPLSVCWYVYLYVCLSVCLCVSLIIYLYLCAWYRVPYQNVVVSLVSNQLLIQCVCALLLRGSHNTVAAEQGISTNHAASKSSTTADDDDTTNLLTSAPPLPGLLLHIYQVWSSTSTRSVHDVPSQQLRYSPFSLTEACLKC